MTAGLKQGGVKVLVCTDAAREGLERGGTYVAIADRDLIVYVVVPRNREIDRTEVCRKLRRFIQRARVDAVQQ